MIDKQVII